MTTTPTSGAADKVLAYLDDLSDDAAAHIFPSDLAKCMTSECVVEVVSVRAGNPNERTVPLFSREQVVAALASTPAQPVAQQGVAYGFFLLPPQRPKPEAPAGTAGLDWDAYSGAQMLAFGRDCSDAALTARKQGANHDR